MLILISSVVIGLMWAVLPGQKMPAEQQAFLLLMGYAVQAHLSWSLHRHSAPDAAFASIGLALWIPVYLSGSALRAEWIVGATPLFSWLWLWNIVVLVVCPLTLLGSVVRTFMMYAPWKRVRRERADG